MANLSQLCLQEYVKTQHPGNLTASDLYNRFHSWENPACRTLLGVRDFYDVIFSLVVIRLPARRIENQLH